MTVTRLVDVTAAAETLSDETAAELVVVDVTNSSSNSSSEELLLAGEVGAVAAASMRTATSTGRKCSRGVGGLRSHSYGVPS